MKLFLFTALVAAVSLPSVQAKNHSRHIPAAAVHRYAPAQEMLQSLDSMSILLNSVHSQQAADLAAPQLNKLYRRYTAHSAAAENMPPMSDKALNAHLANMDKGMNNFRLACARLIQAKFYGSAKLGQTVMKIAQNF